MSGGVGRTGTASSGDHVRSGKDDWEGSGDN